MKIKLQKQVEAIRKRYEAVRKHGGGDFIYYVQAVSKLYHDFLFPERHGMNYREHLEKNEDQLEDSVDNITANVTFSQSEDASDYPNWREQGVNRMKYRRGLKIEETKPKRAIHLKELVTEPSKRMSGTDYHLFGSKI